MKYQRPRSLKRARPRRQSVLNEGPPAAALGVRHAQQCRENDNRKCRLGIIGRAGDLTEQAAVRSRLVYNRISSATDLLPRC
eukprot:3159784-Pyramimonas_sp.AAC.1